MDLVPSIITLTGGAVKAEDYDGIDVSEALMGNKSQVHSPLFFSRPPDRKDYKGLKGLPDLALRHEGWKFYCDFDGGKTKLFDLNQDRREKHNVASEHEDLVSSFKQQALQWYQAVNMKARENTYGPTVLIGGKNGMMQMEPDGHVSWDMKWKDLHDIAVDEEGFIYAQRKRMGEICKN